MNMEDGECLESIVEEAEQNEGKEVDTSPNLKKQVAGWKEEAEWLGVYSAEYISSKLAKRILYETGKEEHAEDTNRGAAAVIYNKETKEVYLELKPYTYPIPEVQGKLALPGGHVDTTDSSSLDALARELGEEVADRKARKIILSRLHSNGKYLGEIVECIDGKIITTDVYTIEVPLEEWHIFKNSELTEGTKQVLTYNEIISMPNSSFAFFYETKLKPFIANEIRQEKAQLAQSRAPHHFTSNQISTINNFGYQQLENVNSNFSHQSPIISNSSTHLSVYNNFLNQKYSNTWLIDGNTRAANKKSLQQHLNIQ